jgi:hypothetical protein
VSRTEQPTSPEETIAPHSSPKGVGCRAFFARRENPVRPRVTVPSVTSWAVRPDSIIITWAAECSDRFGLISCNPEPRLRGRSSGTRYSCVSGPDGGEPIGGSSQSFSLTLYVTTPERDPWSVLPGTVHLKK